MSRRSSRRHCSLPAPRQPRPDPVAEQTQNRTAKDGGFTRSCESRSARGKPDHGSVKFTLEVDLSQTADDPRDELGGAMKQLDNLGPGDRQDIYDSAYTKVGSWTITE